MGRLQGMNGIYGLPQNPMVNVDKLHVRGLALNKKGDYKTALDFFMQAAALSPNSPGHLISAANMLVKLQHPEPARELYETALEHPRLSEKLRSFAEKKLEEINAAIAAELAAKGGRRGNSICPDPTDLTSEPQQPAPSPTTVDRLRVSRCVEASTRPRAATVATRDGPPPAQARFGDEDLLFEGCQGQDGCVWSAGAIFVHPYDPEAHAAVDSEGSVRRQRSKSQAEAV